jgi:cytidine deaminase
MVHKIIETKFSILSYDELSSEEKILIEKSKEQVSKAYAPYSNFNVGAAVLLENGEIFAGSNQENSAYPSGLCAERVAMFYANAQCPNIAVKLLAIAAFSNGKFMETPNTPCGACRQVLLETEDRFEKDITVLLYGSEGIYRLENVRDLLPLSFEKASLNK